MSFSLYHVDGNIPVGLIEWKGTTLHGKVVYVSKRRPGEREDEKHSSIPPHLRADKDEIDDMEEAVIGYGQQKPLDVLGVDFFKKSDHGTNLRKGDLSIMNTALENDEDDLSEYPELGDRPDVKSYMEKKLADAKLELATRKRDFRIGGTLQPLINPYARECVFIIGQAGSGKSTYAAALIKDYLKVKPDNKVYIVSKVSGDPAFSALADKVNFQPLDEAFIKAVEGGMSASVKDCMVVFDDVDTVANEKLKQAIFKLRADLLQTGRHGSAYIVCTSHVFRSGKQTREANMESTSFVVFPGTGDHYHIKDYLKTYGGMTPSQIDRVMRTKSRWVAVHKSNPNFVLHEHGGYFLEYEPLVKSGKSGVTKPRQTSVSMFDFDNE